jgi:hypothetical protein
MKRSRESGACPDGRRSEMNSGETNMKTWQRMGIAVGAVAAAVLLADVTYAAGNGNGAGRRAGGASSAGGSVAKAGTGAGAGSAASSQLRQQLRDGSCASLSAEELAARGGGGQGSAQRLRDGSCLGN